MCAQRRAPQAERRWGPTVSSLLPTFRPLLGRACRPEGAGGPVTEEQVSSGRAVAGTLSTLSLRPTPPGFTVPVRVNGNSAQQSCLTLTRLCREPEFCTCLLGSTRTPGDPAGTQALAQTPLEVDKYFKTRVLRTLILQGQLSCAELAIGSTVVARKIGHFDPAS